MNLLKHIDNELFDCNEIKFNPSSVARGGHLGHVPDSGADTFTPRQILLLQYEDVFCSSPLPCQKFLGLFVLYKMIPKIFGAREFMFVAHFYFMCP